MDTSKFHTLFLRLEGPMQSWGIGSEWTVRDTAAEPTKSGVVGLVCCAMGKGRHEPVGDLARLRMGVRVDRPGALCVDYHTTGAGMGLLSADGKIKRTVKTGEFETVLSWRHYLCDASFLVALQGDRATLEEVRDALLRPVWPVFLGRKACPPCVPIVRGGARIVDHPDLVTALASHPWRPRLTGIDFPPVELRCVLETDAMDPAGMARADVPLSFAPKRHEVRYVREEHIPTPPVGDPEQVPCPRLRRERLRYGSQGWGERRRDRLEHDRWLCVFCKQAATPVHHVTYRRANAEQREDLRSLCRLCHDAVSMIESTRALGIDRIDPCDPAHRDLILAKRAEMLRDRRVRHPRPRR